MGSRTRSERHSSHIDGDSSTLMIAFHLLAGLLIRIMLMIYGAFHDQMFKVRYTDVDYTVFTDGAIYLNQGRSPFFREGYRYTPLLAYLMLPNIVGLGAFGKILFVVFDIATGYLIYRILRIVQKEFPAIRTSDAIGAACIWIYNPLPIIISTRGSSDTIVTFLVLLTILYLIKGQNFLSGLFFGLVVHFKLYPAIYAPAIYLFIGKNADSKSENQTTVQLLNPFTTGKLAFAISAATTFGLTTGFSYHKFGHKYLYEAWIYHFERKDTQHNFSVYFYLYHLVPEAYHHLISKAAFVPQLVSVIVFTVAVFKANRREVLPTFFMSTFAQTFLFVSLNKVITSQYFIWYFALYPLLIPFLTELNWKRQLILLAIWLIGQGQWLLPAYLFEFQKLDWTLQWVWAASIVFLLMNVYILIVLLRNFNARLPARQKVT